MVVSPAHPILSSFCPFLFLPDLFFYIFCAVCV